MNKKIIGILSLVFSFAIFTSTTVAQDRGTLRTIAGDSYVISVKPGAVNFVSGNVYVRKAADSTTQRLIKRDIVKVGDRVITEDLSHAEILLNPGSYARLASNSEFEFVTNDLDDLRLKVIRGSAIFEVYATRDFFVTILTPGSKFYLVKSGVYRVDVLENGGSRIEVRKGNARVGNLDGTKLKKARAADVTGDGIALSKFKRKDRDAFEEWSRMRAKTLAKANAKLKQRTVRNSLLSSYNANRWDTYGSPGLWAFSGRLGGYCYLPFGYGSRSPYGFGLNTGLYDFRLPSYVYYVPNSSSFTNGSRSTSASYTTSSGNTARRQARSERREQKRAEGNTGNSTRKQDRRRSSKSRRTRNSSGSGDKSRLSRPGRSRNSSRSSSPRRSSSRSRPTRRTSPSPTRSAPRERRSSPPARKASSKDN